TNTSARGLSIRRDVFATLRSELLAHALSEQQELYSVLEQHELTRSRAEIGERQHREIEALLQELSLLTATSPEWLARFRELEREVLRHIDEEEHQLFRLAERALTPERLHEIDRRFRIEKKRKLRELETTLH
ncbi:MAG: hemerythrin domain-containing protein, partial [Polyangiaceae bacterium]|nr:hemerythrin domain-containing protein [Polyangiaceae bacterium]